VACGDTLYFRFEFYNDKLIHNHFAEVNFLFENTGYDIYPFYGDRLDYDIELPLVDFPCGYTLEVVPSTENLFERGGEPRIINDTLFFNYASEDVCGTFTININLDCDVECNETYTLKFAKLKFEKKYVK